MLELHHGPTLAFEDVAMRLIAQLYDHILGVRGERMTILCATSGDTGGAAASAFAGSKHVDIVILHPLDRVSPVQRLFMTATGARNVHNLALEGDFDGTQAILKQLIGDDQFRRATNLAAVNSINWARGRRPVRLLRAGPGPARRRPPHPLRRPHRQLRRCAGLLRRSRCGLLNRFECVSAVNANDAMARLISGMPLTRGPPPPRSAPRWTSSCPPTSNASCSKPPARDGAAVAAYRATREPKAKPRCRRPPSRNSPAVGLTAERVSDHETIEEMKRTLAETGFIVWPAHRRRPRRRAPQPYIGRSHRHSLHRPRRQVPGDGAAGARHRPGPARTRAREFTDRMEEFGIGLDERGLRPPAHRNHREVAILMPDSRPDNREVITLPNGARIVFDAMPGLRTASVGVYLGAGARHEPAERGGLAHFLEHMAFKGASGCSAREIAEAVEARGASMNAATDYERTSYFVRCLSADAPEMLDVALSLVFAPDLPPEEIEREKFVVMQEIGEAADDPGRSGVRISQAASFPDHPRPLPILGVEATLKPITRNDLIGFAANTYAPHRTVISVAGALRPRRHRDPSPAAGSSIAPPSPDTAGPPRHAHRESCHHLAQARTVPPRPRAARPVLHVGRPLRRPHLRRDLRRRHGLAPVPGSPREQGPRLFDRRLGRAVHRRRPHLRLRRLRRSRRRRSRRHHASHVG